MATKKIANKVKCECRQTTRDLIDRISAEVGFPITMKTFLRWRARLAQEYCDLMFEADPDAACVGNPYLASERFAGAYVYDKKRANKLVTEIAARVSYAKSMGRRRYFKRIGKKDVPALV